MGETIKSLQAIIACCDAIDARGGIPDYDDTAEVGARHLGELQNAIFVEVFKVDKPPFV